MGNHVKIYETRHHGRGVETPLECSNDGNDMCHRVSKCTQLPITVKETNARVGKPELRNIGVERSGD